MHLLQKCNKVSQGNFKKRLGIVLHSKLMFYDYLDTALMKIKKKLLFFYISLTTFFPW